MSISLNTLRGPGLPMDHCHRPGHGRAGKGKWEVYKERYSPRPTRTGRLPFRQPKYTACVRPSSRHPVLQRATCLMEPPLRRGGLPETRLLREDKSESRAVRQHCASPHHTASLTLGFVLPYLGQACPWFPSTAGSKPCCFCVYLA